MAGIDSTSKTQRALAWLAEDANRKPLEACKKFGLGHPTLYTAIKRQEETANRRCPCCGNIMQSPAPKKKSKR